MILQRFTWVADRQVHYRRCGCGPPVLLIHSSPASTLLLLPLIAELSRRFTCFAFDTPGFGLSEPLSLQAMTVADLADAIAANAEAVGLPPCPVFGTHTGAAVALELAVRHPARVTGLVLDGLPVFTDAECDELLAGYFAPFPIDILGGHFNRVWTRFRDQSIWFPWFGRAAAHLNPYDLGTPESTHQWVSMYYDAAMHYTPAYRAALGYGARGLGAVSELETPTVFTASDTDMLYPHLSRLPPLKTGQQIIGFGKTAGEKHALIAAHFARLVGGDPPPADDVALLSTKRIRRQFVDTGRGQVHVRWLGDRAAPHLLLLHDAPGSARSLDALMADLARHFFVCAPDLPGCGETAGLSEGARTIGDYAQRMVELCAGTRLDRPLVYGIGFGSSVALALAQLALGAVRGLALCGALIADDVERADLRANYAPPIGIESDGAHWYRTWLMLRDSLIYWPWYERRLHAQRHVDASFDATRLHTWTVEVMKQHGSYHHVIQAALDHDARAALAAIGVTVALCTDSGVPLSVYDARLADAAPQASHCPAGDIDALACLFADDS